MVLLKSLFPFRITFHLIVAHEFKASLSSNHASRIAHRNAARWHRTHHHCAGTNNSIVTDRDLSQEDCIGSHVHAIAQNRHTSLFPASPLPNRNALRQIAVPTNPTFRVDEDAAEMPDVKSGPNIAAGRNTDPAQHLDQLLEKDTERVGNSANNRNLNASLHCMCHSKCRRSPESLSQRDDRKGTSANHSISSVIQIERSPQADAI